MWRTVKTSHRRLKLHVKGLENGTVLRRYGDHSTASQLKTFINGTNESWSFILFQQS